MSLKYKILNTQNRIEILSANGKDNSRIIAKLKRELKHMTAE